MSGVTLSGKGAGAALRRGGRHSRRVGRLRFILPATALMMLLMVLAWPWLSGGYHGLIMPVFKHVVGDGVEPMRMLKPRYVGRTSNQEAYEVTADSAFLDPGDPDRIRLDRLTAIVERRADDDVHVRANEGFYYRDRESLDLKGDLELRLGERYIFRTSEASVSFGQNEVVGKTPITGEGPLGTLSADRFKISDGGDHLSFEGRVQVIYKPEAPSF
jgi:lipopolysaccharide export system protein LptC